MTGADPSGLRVAVIGAGAGGLSIARLLQLRGASVTVIEALDRAGGMCRSIEHKGRWFDIGANYLTKDYREVRALAKDLGLPLTTDRSLVDQVSLDVDTGTVVDAQQVFNDGHSKPAFLLAALRYLRWQWRYRELVAAPGFAGVADEPDLMCSIGDWLRRHRMQPLQKLFMLPITAMGYGTLEDMPAPHALRYINASVFISLLKTGLHIPQAWPKRFVGGFGSMWQVVADQLDVEYETTTLAIDRSDGVRITTERDGVRQVREFDRLVLALAPHDALGFLDATDAERALYDPATILCNRYLIQTAEVESFTRWVVNTLQPAPDDSGAFPPPVGHPYIFGKQWKPADLVLFYAPVGTDVTEEGARTHMRADLEMTSEGDPGWVGWGRGADWPRYFPRVSVADMASFQGGPGWYDQVEALQGQNHTYLCHGIVAFELVERIMRYARHLVEERFE